MKMDPRVKTTADGLALEFQKQQVLAEMMTKNTEAVTTARALREQVQKLIGKTPGTPGDNSATQSKLPGPLADAVSAFGKKLSGILGGGGFGVQASPSPTLSRASGAIAGLYSELDRSDAAPTAAQLAAIDATEKDSSAVLKLWQEFQATDLPALNRQLKSAGFAELQPASKSPVSGADDDGDIE